MRALPLLCLLAIGMSGCSETGNSPGEAETATFHERVLARIDVGDASGPLTDAIWAARLRFGDPEAYGRRGWRRARVFELDGALADLNEAIRRRPDYGFAYASRGFVHRMRLQLDLAETDLNEAVRLEPSWFDAYLLRSGLLLHRGDLEGARRDLDVALGLYPSGPALASRCLVAVRLGEETAEARCVAAFAARDERSYWVPLIQGGLLMLRTELAGARRAIDKSLALLPRNPQALLLRGHLRSRIGDIDGGSADIEAARSTLPSVDALVQALFGPLPSP